MVSKKLRLLVVLTTAFGASGCASIPADRGMADVNAAVVARGGPEVPAIGKTAETMALPDRPLWARDAVQIALMRNPQLRKGYAELGISGADVYEAGRLSNPTFSLTVLDPSGIGAANQVTMGLAQNFTQLLMLPMRSRIAEGEFERAKALVGHDILRLTADVLKAYYNLVSAQQVTAMREVVTKAARASADLAQRFYDAGNIPELQLRAEQAAASDAALQLLEAQARTSQARAELGALLGLRAGAETWSVPTALTLPPSGSIELETLQKIADANRLDLAAARKELELLRAGVTLTKRFRYFSAIELGVERERDTDRSKLTGPTLSLALPIFNQNQAGILRAKSRLEHAQAELDALEIAISNDVQFAYQRVINAQARINEYRARLVPAREKVVARMQERVNYMLDGIFDLLRLKQDEYTAYQGYLEAVRDYWIARTDLSRLIAADLPDSHGVSSETVEPMAPEQPANAGHAGHGAMPRMEMPKHSEPMDDMPGMDMPGMDMKGGSSSPETQQTPTPATGMPDGGGETHSPSGSHHHH